MENVQVVPIQNGQINDSSSSVNISKGTRAQPQSPPAVLVRSPLASLPGMRQSRFLPPPSQLAPNVPSSTRYQGMPLEPYHTRANSVALPLAPWPRKLRPVIRARSPTTPAVVNRMRLRAARAPQVHEAKPVRAFKRKEHEARNRLLRAFEVQQRLEVQVARELSKERHARRAAAASRSAHTRADQKTQRSAAALKREQEREAASVSHALKRLERFERQQNRLYRAHVKNNPTASPIVDPLEPHPRLHPKTSSSATSSGHSASA